MSNLPPKEPWQVEEFEFPAGLMGRLRNWIHGLAGRWPLRAAIQQQNAINAQQKEEQALLRESLGEVDKETMHTRKQVAELTTLVAKLNQKIDALEAELKSQE